MEEEATQPATQLVIDPRRLGQGNSGLSDDDLADICCILHPFSPPAYRAAAQIYEETPEHTINTYNNVTIQENGKGAVRDVGASELEKQGLVPRDIALRLSTDLKDPIGGFHFGRNKQRCDIVIGQNDNSRRISNVHFRIYINEHRVLMLEDQSTNGTAVDGTLLRGKEKENGRDWRHTLEQGSVIVLTMTPPEEDYRFIVRIPQRDHESENVYQQNLNAFFLRMTNTQLENETRAAAANGTAKRQPINLFPNVGTTTNPLSISGRLIREWRGGPKYNKIGVIGKGAFAVVYKFTAKFDGVPYAAKELEKRRFMKNGVLDQKVDNEMKIMSKIKHANVVQYIEHIDWEEYLYIIMEFVPGGDLGSLINESGHLPEVDVKDMARQLLSALKHLHGMGITHRDVKPDNILIFTREPFHVKLTDFGLSKMVDSEETFLRTFCGTLLYCAPEVYSEYREYDDAGRRNLRGANKKSLPPQRYGHAVDVWSLAGVLFYALCGSPPYPVKNGTSYQELLNHIMTQPLDIRPLQYATVSDSGIRFVRNMLHVRPEHRATIEELVCSSWLTGVDSVEASMDFDEVDMIGDGIIDPELEQGTSQLSIRNPDGGQIADSDEGIDNFSDLTEIQRLEIPSSFSTDSKSSRNGSYGFMQTNNGSRNGRLFGEVNASDLGSSGAVPFEQLNLPVPTNHRDVDLSHSQESRDTESEFGYGSSRVEGSQVHPTTEATMSMPPPPPPHNAVNAVKNQDIDERAARSSSLMGAESMVGHLNMHSPASAPSPNADSPMATTEEFRPTISLRRPREEDVDDDGSWRPSDLPAKRRRRSEREIDMPLPPSIFWDPRDKSTHHYNYPRMSSSDLETYQEYAKMKGERFVAGQKTFEATMQSFRSSRSPSLEPEASTRAHSEPTKEEGRRMLMKRDERKLATESNGEGLGSMSNGGPTLDEFIPSTAHPSNVDISPEPATSTRNGTYTNSQPVVGNDFQQPKRILAKLIATPDSCLPTITLNITESMTSWGRGVNATVRYTNGQEVRIPKYAFKILQFKPGFYAESTVSAQNPQVGKGRDKDHDMTFYISSKASVGIWVNNINIPYFDRQNPNTESKFWGEIRHGDLITVWRHDLDPTQFTRFRFECYWGNSKEARKEGEEFRLLEDGDILAEIERICLTEERAILAEQARLQEQEKMMVQKEKEREKLARERPFNFNQSFASAPQTS